MMNKRTGMVLASACAAALLTLTMAACSSTGSSDPIGGDVIAPVTMSVNELPGETIDLVVGQVLNINTDSLAVDSYSAEISDPAVAEFVQGRNDGSAEYNPGLTALAEGRTDIVLTNTQGSIQPLEFTVLVSPSK